MLCRLFPAPFLNSNHVSWTVDHRTRGMLQLCVPQCQVHRQWNSQVPEILLINPIYHLILDLELTQLINDHESYELIKMETCPKEPLIKICISYKNFISVQSFAFFCLGIYLFIFMSPANTNNLFQWFAIFMIYHPLGLHDIYKYYHLKPACLYLLLCLFPWDSDAFILETVA